MKAFREWWIENHYTHYDDRGCKVGWKAALQWVLNHPDLIDHYMLDYVKEELLSEQGDN